MSDTARAKVVENTLQSPPGAFRVATGRWLAQMFFQSSTCMTSVGIILACALAMGIYGAVCDLRVAILALILLFLLLPMVLSMLFFIFGLKETNALNTTLHTVELLQDGGLRITVFRPNPNDTRYDTRETAKTEGSEEMKWETARQVDIPAADLVRKVSGFGGVWVEIKDRRVSQWIALNPDAKGRI